MARLAVNDAPAALRSASDGRESHERSHRWHFEPAAAWMTPEAFASGGTLDRLTAGFARQYGHRALEVWRRDLLKFAGSSPITAGTIDRHARQSASHWALHRAAALALADARYGVRHEPAPAAVPAPATQTAPAPSRSSFGWGGARKIPWGRR